MKKLTTKQTAEELNISTRRVRALIDSGDLVAEKVGRDWIIEEQDLERVRNRKGGKPAMKGRMTWVTDIIEYAPGSEMAVYRKPGETQYEIYDPKDSEYQRLLEQDGITEDDVILCEYAIRLGNAGMSALDPFETLEKALEWIEGNQDGFYFIKQTHPELKRRFPNIPVRMHPAEVEKAFGISEN